MNYFQKAKNNVRDSDERLKFESIFNIYLRKKKEIFEEYMDVLKI